MAMAAVSVPFSASVSEKAPPPLCTFGATPEMVAGCLKEFLEIAVKMAQVDEAVISATANAPPPEASEAQKWHDVSVRALQWTRTSLAAQQDSSLSQLKDAVLSRRGSVALMTDVVAEKAVDAK